MAWSGVQKMEGDTAESTSDVPISVRNGAKVGQAGTLMLAGQTIQIRCGVARSSKVDGCSFSEESETETIGSDCPRRLHHMEPDFEQGCFVQCASPVRTERVLPSGSRSN